MATAPDSSANNTPSSPVAKADGAAAGATVSSPQSRRSLQAPWAQVVRGGGGEVEAASVSSPRSPSPLVLAAVASPEKISISDDCSAAQKSSPENSTSDALPESSGSNDGNVGRPKKPAWNKPLNGVVEAVTVMGGALSWPALSESTRPGPKSSADSSKPIPDGSTSVSQGPIISQLPQKQANSNANTNSNANPSTPVRQRSMKHRGGSSSSGGAGSGPGGGGFIRTPLPPPTPPPLPPPFPGMPPYGNLIPPPPPPVLEPHVRGPRSVGGFPSQPHSAGDHSPHRNYGRKGGNFGGRPRGDGSYHNNHGGRRDQDRRDVHMAAPQFGPPHAAFMRPPPAGSGPFLPHTSLRPFPVPMGYDMGQFYYVPLSPESFSSVPIINQAPPLPQLFPLVDPNLPPSLVNQIEYYFSDANLVKDNFLRLKMDEEGWVPIKLIAEFPRVKSLTDKVQFDNIQFISYCLATSMLVEVQDEKIRRRDDWRKWTHTSSPFAADSGSSAPVASTDGALTTSLQNVSLNESTTNSSGATEATNAQMDVPVGGLSDESTNQSALAQEGNAEEISSSHA
ncbi:la-related protein 1C-like [Nicotiana sylvestris]|uniref:La-related protein 1C-like n=1 Tax=Nicotiana sylvestris TaxID=4096 RepID=A0A1U7ULL7_NICSY|nr:PREDICTED: la-related protein 1C-like [Nicotiana sylvestris]